MNSFGRQSGVQEQQRRIPPLAVSKGDRRLRGWLFLFFFLSYFFFYSGHFSSVDEVHVFETTRAILTHGDLAIPEILNTRRGTDGRYYSKYMIGQSVLVMPLFLLGVAAEAILPADLAVTVASVHLRDERVTWGGTLPIFFTGLYSPLASAFLMLAFYILQGFLGIRPRSALAATLLVGISSYVMGMSVHFLRHTSQAAAVLVAFIGLLDYRARRRILSLLGAGIAAGMALQFRIDGLLVLPGLVGSAAWLAFREGKQSTRTGIGAFSGFLIPVAASLLLALGIHYSKWGFNPMNDGVNLLGGDPLTALYGFLLSPGSSVFLFSPLLLLAGSCWKRLWLKDRWMSCSVLATGLPFLILYCFYIDWHGLWSLPGPRYLFVPMLLGLLPIGSRIERMGTVPQRILAGLLVAAGASFQVVLATVNFPYIYVPLQLPSSGPEASLFIPSRSIPVLLVDNFLAGRYWDNWFLNIWNGAPDVAARPALAAALIIIWFLGWLLSGSRLLQAWRGMRR